MVKLSLGELGQIVRMRGIKSYKNTSKERLISSINELEPVKKVKRIFMKQEQKRSKKI